MPLTQPYFGAALVVAALLGTAPSLRAVGPDEPDAPPSNPTTTACAEGTVWDPARRLCRPAEHGALSDDMRYDAVRALAHSGRFVEATVVLDAMREGETDRVLTYRGFLARKAGDMPRARAAYAAALALNPDNLLARSYLGLGLLAEGDAVGARAQLREIRRRGGRDTWAEVALRLALGSGVPTGY